MGLETNARADRSTLVPPTQQPDATTVFKPGSGVELPRVKKEVRPKYTADARDRGIEGTVWIEVVVLPNGKVGE
ncbi:MAG: energy transducer TonB [Vicinamibacteria bacterium]|nr:energy transducer TonB [Vicinamibacteria bacterium]